MILMMKWVCLWPFGIAYRLNKPVWDVQLRLGYYPVDAEEHSSHFM